MKRPAAPGRATLAYPLFLRPLPSPHVIIISGKCARHTHEFPRRTRLHPNAILQRRKFFAPRAHNKAEKEWVFFLSFARLGQKSSRTFIFSHSGADEYIFLCRAAKLRFVSRREIHASKARPKNVCLLDRNYTVPRGGWMRKWRTSTPLCAPPPLSLHLRARQ